MSPSSRFPRRVACPSTISAIRVERKVGHPIDGADDHGVSVAVYLSDPDGNGIELCYDRPRQEWFDEEGTPNVKTEPFTAATR